MLLKPDRPLIIKDLFDVDVINNHIASYDANEDYTFTDDLDNSEPHVYWYKLLYKITKKIKSRQNDKKIARDDYTKLLSFFEIDTMAYIYINFPKYRCSDVLRGLECLDGRFAMMDSLMSMSWQWYMEQRNSEVVFNLWQTFKDLHKMKIFEDDRFSIHPIFTNAYQKGMDRSPWLKDMAAGWLTVYEETTGEKKLQKYTDGAYNSNYMDGKVGFVIYFKSMPSMLISFNCDSEWNLFIHQIQCKPKDRGHYKLKNWQQSCLELVQNVFSDFKPHLIKGESLVEFIPEAYSQAEEVMKPTKTTLQRIAETYNTMFDNFGKVISKSNIEYHEIVTTHHQ